MPSACDPPFPSAWLTPSGDVDNNYYSCPALCSATNTHTLQSLENEEKEVMRLVENERLRALGKWDGPEPGLGDTDSESPEEKKELAALSCVPAPAPVPVSLC